MLASAKQTNMLDEYSTSRTLEKCTCFHCKKSQGRQKRVSTDGCLARPGPARPGPARAQSPKPEAQSSKNSQACRKLSNCYSVTKRRSRLCGSQVRNPVPKSRPTATSTTRAWRALERSAQYKMPFIIFVGFSFISVFLDHECFIAIYH